MKKENKEKGLEITVKKKWKCVGKGIILAGILAGGLASCGKEQTKREQEPITLTFFNADGSEDPWTDPIAQAITEATGVTLETQYPSQGNADEIALMIATGEYPDLIFAKGDSNLLLEHDALIDMSELIEEYGPHIKELYGEEFEKLRYSSENPAIYQLSSTEVGDEILTTAGTAQLQWAVLEENDYQIPTTLEEYTEMIQSYLDKHPTINGKKTIGLSLSCADWHWYITLSDPAGYIANGSMGDGQWIVEEGGNVRYKHCVENQKEYFKWLNQLYAKGILDSEFATQTHEEYIEKITEGRVLALLDSERDYADAEITLEQNGMSERTYAGLPVTLDESVTCNILQNQGYAVGWGIGITKACKNPERAIQFLDWMCTEEAQILLNWGIEGVDYVYNEEGTRINKKNNKGKLAKTYREETGIGLHIYPFPAYGNTKKDKTGNYYKQDFKENVVLKYNEAERKALRIWNCTYLTDIFPQAEELKEPEYAPIWSKTLPSDVVAIVKKLDELSWESLVDCIVCDETEFEERWEVYQNKLEELGVHEAEASMTELIQKEIRPH